MPISISSLHFEWPGGTTVFEDFDLTVGPGRHGLVGLNGSGKSTLLRLIAGHLAPESGSISTDGELAYLPQDAGLSSYATVDDVIGMPAIRPEATLGRLGLSHLEPDRPLSTLSGGELVLLSLAARLLADPSVLLLDEPTNNLDRDARGRLYEAIAGYRGTLLVVSHDRELLNLMDSIADLREGSVQWYGGSFDDYEAALAVEQEAAARAVRAAESDLRRQKRELVEANAKLDRRKRYGQKMWDQKREPKIVMGARKRSAQESAGKHRNIHLDRLATARDHLTEAEEGLRDDREIRVDLPHTAVPPGRQVLSLIGGNLRFGGVELDLEVRGPERIGLVGRNGSGKSTLLRTLVGEIEPLAGELTVHVPARYVPQRVDVLDPARSVADNARALAPNATETERRTSLARFLFRGARADQEVASLSGGELLRATLACLMLADPAPQLLLLDEPTNNLDLASIRQLGEALTSYEGALIVASHDYRFLDEIGLTRLVEL